MKRTFNCNFAFAFTLFSESRNSMKMKRTFDIVISALLSHCFLKVTIQFKWKWQFLKVVIQWTWKGLSTSSWFVFKAKASRFPFSDLFWKSQFNKTKRTFKCNFGFVYRFRWDACTIPSSCGFQHYFSHAFTCENIQVL